MARLSTLIFIVGLGFLLIVLTQALPFGEPPMAVGTAIQQAAPAEVGSANIVTAVVLAYRGMDTLGELSILFAAAMAGGLVLGRGRNAAQPAGGRVLTTGIDLVFPLLIVAGLYIVTHGHLTPGGGFQGGVILAAAFFLPTLARPGNVLDHQGIAIIEGLSGVAFIGIGLASLLQREPFLTPWLASGVLGEVVSGGTLPLLYLAVGLKVGAELAGLLSRLSQDEEVQS